MESMVAGFWRIEGLVVVLGTGMGRYKHKRETEGVFRLRRSARVSAIQQVVEQVGGVVITYACGRLAVRRSLLIVKIFRFRR
jgi:hypothetical protein